MSDIINTHGAFSAESIPAGWKPDDSKLTLYISAIDRLFPEGELISPIIRGGNSSTFVIREDGIIKICQFDVVSEASQSTKYTGSMTRMNHIRSYNVDVPNILDEGVIDIAGTDRTFIVMDFVKGLGADIFLKNHPDKNNDFYYKMGSLIAQLGKVPVVEEKTNGGINLIDRINTSVEELVRMGLLNGEQTSNLYNIINKRLEFFGSNLKTYVHLDPYPVNFNIIGKGDSFEVKPLDVEAINVGHPLIEGLGIAIKSGIYDWNYITGKNNYQSKIQAIELIRGYSDIFPDTIIFVNNPDLLDLLLETAEIISIPKTILNESKKESPAEYYEWTLNRFYDLIANTKSRV